MKNDLLKIINNYEVKKQQRQLNEEVFELQEAIRDYEEQKRACLEFCSTLHCDKEKEHITEEIADVMVLLSQFKYYFELDNEKIKKIMEEKIARQLERMKNE